MFKNGSFRQFGAAFIAITVSAVMLATACADPIGKQGPVPKPKIPNPNAAEPSKTTHNGHSNASTGKGPNPASNNGKGHKNGHDKHTDQTHDHPGVGSLFDLFGIHLGGPEDDEQETESETNSEDTQEPIQLIPPDSSTDDPFSDVAAEDGESGGEDEAETEEAGGPEFGSLPLIRNDEKSTDFILEKLISGAQEAAWAKGEQPAPAPALKAAYHDYAKKLVKTLSRMSQAEQNFIFYGRKQ